jgi:predicted dehydrogenase
LVTRINFAVVGTGAMATRMMDTFKRAKIHVVAIVSHDIERARTFAARFNVPISESNLSAVLARSDVDAVYVANAAREHSMVCIAALEAGKAVLCEKPIALCLADAQRVAEVARSTRMLCMEGLWTLFLPAYQRFFEIPTSGAWGRAGSLVADFGYPRSEEIAPRAERGDFEGVLLDRGVYLIALSLRLFGAVQRVHAGLRISAYGDEEAFLQLLHDNGGHSQLAMSFTSLMSNTATLHCSEGLVQLQYPLIGSEGILTTRYSNTSPSPETAREPSLRMKALKKLKEFPILRRVNRGLSRIGAESLPYGSDQYLPQVEHFAALLRARAHESEVVPLEFSLDVQRVIESVRAAHSRSSQERT